MGKNRDDDENSDELWFYVTRDVKPLKPVPKRQNSQPRSKKKPTASPRMPTPPVPVAKSDPGKKAADLDRRTDEKLRRGQMAIDGRIDLHGMGRDRAYETLNGFLLAGYRQGYRCVLVITGKGKDGKGVLRAEVPAWLREGALANIVLRFYPAKPEHGGQGALYVLLRRNRD